jgi:hypothetical protein
MVQESVSQQYEAMHHPYEAHWYVHLLTAANYFFMLPALLAGLHTHQTGARLLSALIAGSRASFASLVTLAARIERQAMPASRPALRNNYPRTINWQLRGPAPEAVARHFGTFLRRNSHFRLQLLRDAGLAGHGEHLVFLARELALSVLVPALFAGRPLTGSALIARLVGAAAGDEPALVPPDSTPGGEMSAPTCAPGSMSRDDRRAGVVDARP